MLLNKTFKSENQKVTTEEIHHAFHDALMGFFIKKVRDRNLADDLFQETLLKIHLHLDKLEDLSKVTSWIFQIARNVISDYYRKINPVSNSVQLDTIDEERQLEEETKAPSFMTMSGCIDDMVEALPEKYREALKLCDLSKLSQKDVASMLGLSLSALKSRVLRGRQELKKIMGDCCKSSVSENCGSKITESSCGCQEYNAVIQV